MHLANALSVPSDAEDRTEVSGRQVCDLYAGANLHPSFALEHHGFFHPGYAARALLSLFSAAYAFEDAGHEIPDLLLRHVPDVWDVQRRLLLWDGRLAYPAGNDYPRYCLGMLYMLPVLVFIQHHYDDKVAAWAERRLGELIVREQRLNGDGSFCACRLERWRKAIEGDGAVPPPRPAPSVYYRSQVDSPYYAALAWWWHRRNGLAEQTTDDDVDDALSGPFCEPDCGLVFHRSRERFSSWSWRAYPSGAQGTVLPRGGDHIAEWEGNLISRFYVRGAQCDRRVIQHEEHAFDGGVATIGTMATCGDRLKHTVTFAALPDGQTTVYCSNARAVAPVQLLLHEGMCLNVANDVFNGNSRTFYWQKECREIAGVGASRDDIQIESPWVNVDDLLGIIELDDRERFTLCVEGERRADGLSLCYDQLLHPHHELRRTLAPGATVEDAAIAFVTSIDAYDTARWPGWHVGPARAVDNTRALTVRGQDDVWYLLAASFSDTPANLHLPLTMQAANSEILVGGRDQFGLVGDGAVLALPPRGMVLVALAANDA
jgi:hypothetical protein